MNRHQKKALSLAAAIANLSFAVATTSVATYAWYTANATATINVNTASATIVTSGSDVSLTYEVLKFDDDLKEGVSYQGSASEFKLRKYDRYIGYNHEYENAIIRAIVSFNGVYNADKEININITCTQPFFHATETTKVIPYTSNIIQFKSSVVSYIDGEDAVHTMNSFIEDESDPQTGWVEDAAASYETARVYFKSQKAATSYVSAYNNTAEKHSTYTITEVPYLPISDDDDTTIKSAVIYLECSYNEEAVKYYINNQPSDSVYTGLKITKEDLIGDINRINFEIADTVKGGYEKVTSDPLDGNGQVDYTGKYLFVYDGVDSKGGDVLLDGGLSSSYLEAKANFAYANIQGGTINSNSVVDKKSFAISKNNSYYNISGNAGKIGHTTGSSDIKTGDYKNTISSMTVKDADNDASTKSLAFYDNSTNARFGYYESGASGYRAVDMYKYSDDFEPKLLMSIAVTTAKANYNVGDEFVYPTVVTATYDDESTTNVASYVVCTGYEDVMDVSGDHKIHVYYTENNITVQTTYTIRVSGMPFVELNKTEVTIAPSGTVSLTATAHNFQDGLSYSWSTGSSSVATISPTSGQTITVTGVASGNTTITVTVTDNASNSVTETCVVYVQSAMTAYYQKVTSEPASWAGKYLIVYEADSKAFDGSLATLDAGNNVKSVTINNNKITADNCDFYFTIAEYSTGYSIQSASGKYIGWSTEPGGSNGLTASASALLNTISYNTSDSCTNIVGSGGKYLHFNSSSGDSNYRFRYYDSTSQQAIQLYKEVAANELVSLSYSGTPATQLIGSSFNKTGLTFTATYANGTSNTVTTSVSVDDSSVGGAGTYDLTASYTENGVTKTVVVFDVTYVVPVVESITLSGTITKDEYLTTDSLDPTGLVVTAHYSGGGSTQINNADVTWTVSSDNSTWTSGFSAGEDVYYVKATYDGHSDSTNDAILYVYARALTSITITGQTTSFANNAKFAFGGTCTAHYNEDTGVESSATVTPSSYHLDSANGTTITTNTTLTNASHNNHEIYVKYTEGGVTKTAHYTITVTGSTPTQKTVKWNASSGALNGSSGGTISSVNDTSTGTISTGSFSWSFTRTLKSGTDSVGWNANSQGAIQLGKNGGVENLQFTTSNISGTIDSITVECASYGGAHNLSITVGGNSYYNGSSPAWGSGTIGTKTGTGSSSGTIEINFTSGSRALYIKSITVVYTS